MLQSTKCTRAGFRFQPMSSVVVAIGLVCSSAILTTVESSSSHLRRRASDTTASTGTCGQPIVTTFDADANGSPFARGAVLNDSVELTGGLTMKARKSQRGPRGAFLDGMIFDAANPTGRDFDLGTQPQQGNIFIISADNDPTDPDDAGRGGVMIGTFAQEVTLSSMKVFDIEKGLTIDVYADVNRRVLLETVGLAAGVAKDGSVMTLTIGVDSVRAFRVSLVGSGAIDDVRFTVPCPPALSPPPTPSPTPPKADPRVITAAPSMAPVEFPSVMPAKYINPELTVKTTIVEGGKSDGTAATVDDCPGKPVVEAPVGTNITYCFRMENTGDTILTTATLVDRSLGVEQFVPLLQPGDSITFTHADLLEKTMKNTLSATGIPVFADLQPMPNIPTPMDSDQSQVVMETPPPTCPSAEMKLTKIDFAQDVLGNALLSGMTITTQSTLLDGMTTVEAIRSQSTTGDFDDGVILDQAALDAVAGLHNADGNALTINSDGAAEGINSQGGVYRLKFLRPAYLASFRLWRSEISTSDNAKDEYQLFTSTGPVYTRPLPSTNPGGGFQTVAEMQNNVVEMRITVHAASAVDDIYLCI